MSTHALNLRLLSSLLRPQSTRLASVGPSYPSKALVPLWSHKSRPRPQLADRSLPITPYSTSTKLLNINEPNFQPPSSPSVSPAETAHFSRLASSWWDPQGPSRLLHAMNPLRHEILQECLSYSPGHPQTLRILDVGTGAGIFAESAARLAETDKVVAIDPTQELIEVAKSHMRTDPMLCAEGKLEYRCCSIEQLGSHPGQRNDDILDSEGPEASSVTAIERDQFSVISVFEVLEHISDPGAFLRQLSDYLTPGGWLIGSTISRSVVSYVTTKLVAEAPLVGLVPPGTHTWDQYIKPEELRRSLWKQGCWEDGDMIFRGCIYVPGFGWKWVPGSESFGNYFFGVRKGVQP